jgi:type III secretion system YopN/LcrE/InvE/MxiC family regulator
MRPPRRASEKDATVAIARIEDTGAASSALSLASTSAADAIQVGPPLDGGSPVLVSEQEWLADASEELTFQFSAALEAKEKSLEERMNPVDTGFAEITVERIRNVLQLMEGEISQSQIRDTTLHLARAYLHDGAGDAPERPEVSKLDPGKQYALLRLTKDELIRQGHTEAATRVDQDLNTLWATQGTRVRASLNIATIASECSTDGVTQDEFRSTYYRLIESAPSSIKSLFQKLVELGADDGPNKAHHLLQRALWMDLQSVSPSMDKMKLLQAASAVVQAGQICQTMIALARDFTARFGEAGVRADGLGRGAFELRVASELINIGDSMSPAKVLLDKVAALLMGTSIERQRAIRFFSALYNQMLLWPMAIWAMQDRKETVLTALKKLLDKRAAVS